MQSPLFKDMKQIVNLGYVFIIVSRILFYKIKKERYKTERFLKLSVLRRSFLCAAELTTLH